jgi:hypothetical protein
VKKNSAFFFLLYLAQKKNLKAPEARKYSIEQSKGNYYGSNLNVRFKKELQALFFSDGELENAPMTKRLLNVSRSGMRGGGFGLWTLGERKVCVCSGVSGVFLFFLFFFFFFWCFCRFRDMSMKYVLEVHDP